MSTIYVSETYEQFYVSKMVKICWYFYPINKVLLIINILYNFQVSGVKFVI